MSNDNTNPELNATKEIISELENTISHSFSPVLAKLYGIECSILINYIAHWIGINRRTGKNFHEGRTWMYQTLEDIAAYFEYWTAREVKYLVDKLVQQKVLIKGNFNKSPFDRTCWYAFNNEKMFTKDKSVKCTNKNVKSNSEKCQTYTSYKTDTKTEVLSVAATPAAELPPSDKQTEPPATPLKKISYIGRDQKEIILDPSDLISKALSQRKDWKIEEMQQAWEILSSYGGIVYDWWKFISGIIAKLRDKALSNKITQGKYTCHKQKNNKNNEKNISSKEPENLSEKTSITHVSLNQTISKIEWETFLNGLKNQPTLS